jgi:hypothetical protein
VDDPRKLKNELEVAARVAGTLTDIRAAQEVERYMREVEAKLRFPPRPNSDVLI